MASYLSIEDSEGLKAIIDKKAPDLFQSRLGKPQLQVNKCLKKTEEGIEHIYIEELKDVRSIFDIRDLRRVCNLVLQNS